MNFYPSCRDGPAPIPAVFLVQNVNAVLSPAALRRKARLDSLAAIEFPADLPVVQKREDLARAIADNQVVIVCGETGSGKTTQLPKICLTLGRGVLGCIGHTQPRRVAARTVATRIAFELKTELGGAVGYKVRFHDKVSQDTSVKLMTDGILLAEIHSDPLLRNYDTLIIDEAHERSLNIDFLLGYLKQLLPRRPDLKLIITSATLDADRFSRHFNALVIEVSGRSYPVETRYRPLQISEEGEAQDVPQAVSSALVELAAGGLRGDVLVFLPGEREIRDTAEALRKHHPKGIEVLPLFARLSAAEQDRVFKTGAQRRVVLATNVAETSLTVPNIGYVIDCGLARVNRYSIRQKVEQLHIEKISRAAANQRAGRCGRVMSGVCVRLYDEADFLQRVEFTDPEIFRVSLATVILRMSALELGEISEFPFIEPPTPRMIADGYQLLAELGAIDESRQLTQLGHELAKLPLDPKIARLLLAGRQYHCLTEILIIASALSVQDPRERPLDRQEAADAAHKRFADERSDFLAYPKIWAWFEQALADKKSNRLLAEECRRNFLSPLRLREWRELHQQLHGQVAEMGMLKNSLSHRGRAGEGESPLRHSALPEALLTRARELRKNATDAENLLWQLLRRNQILGYDFRRQHPAGSYILDFYCHQAKLAIELDGGQHAEEAQRAHDDKRSDWLEAQGIKVLRFWNNEVLTNTEGVLQSLFDWLCEKSSTSTPSLALPRGEREQSGGVHGVSPSPLGGGVGEGAQPATYEQIHKALLCGLLGNIGMKSVESNEYLGARGIKFFIAPNSVLAKKGTKWVMAGELIETHRLYARCVARIEPEWLEEVGSHLIKRHYYDPHWEKKAAQVVAYERSTLHGLLLNAKKRVNYGPMNVAESREVFIRQALVGGEFETRAPFFAHNQKLIADIEALEHKSRRPDVLVDEELIFAFYDSRIPSHFSGHGLHNGATFEAWRKEAEHKDPKLLYLKKDDLMRHEAAGITTDQYPPQLNMDNVSFALGYNFSPGRNDDGITLTVPLALINQVVAARCEWLIPGILAEKVAQLVKTLPQKLRRNLVPVPEFAAAFCREVQPSGAPLLQALARYIREQKQIDVPLDAFRPEQLPPHLLMNFRIVDEHGRQLGMSRNFAQLHGELAPHAAPTIVAATEKKGEALSEQRYTSWSFGVFAETSVVKRAGQSVTLFNALVDDGDAVVLRAFDTRDAAQAAHRGGLRRLFMLLLKEQVKYLEKNLPDAQRLGMLFMAPNSPFSGTQQELQQQILAMTFERCCLNDPLPANEAEFTARGKEAKNRLLLIAQELARLVGNVLTEYQAVQKNLPQLKAHAQASQDVRAQLEWLLHKRFIADTPYERLQHVPRYLKAINLRIEKLRANPARDAQCIAQMQPLTQAWQKLRQVQQGNSDPRVEEFAWMLQELRVSLFAQELKTPVIVSVKRLEKMLAGIRN
ncbi:MAG: ATP-dependent helicase HrpA [Candidatus Gallionella acididurans]|uniref:ATP-dependent helicase HrpA n=1 Tax=Candidatus Gallionella acididurans TaxID=1796491 RepID=A0A139BX82_9PROT|nr:MAG: ATP-dependent helicase HrpA [Candidatus Gallionella acididurans]